MNASEVKAILNLLGFRTNTTTRYRQAVRDFQSAWALGEALKIDGVPGPKTSYALDKSRDNHKAGRGDLSTHFSFNEFDCKCGGKYSACRRIGAEGKAGSGKRPLRTLVLGLEEMRDKNYSGGMTIVSGFRCTGHNNAVGGATSSQHRYCAAADIAEVVRPATAKAYARFSGLGVDGSSGKIRHVDVRHASGYNPTKSSVSNPAQWTYAA